MHTLSCFSLRCHPVREAKQERINRTKRKVEATPLKYGDDPLPTPNQLEKLPPIEFKRSDRVPLIQELIQLGWEHILDKSHTGTGKSHEANLIKADEGKTFYILTQHRNPSVSTAENKTDIPSRHQGLTLDHNRLTPNGNPYQHRWEYSSETPQPDIIAIPLEIGKQNRSTARLRHSIAFRFHLGLLYKQGNVYWFLWEDSCHASNWRDNF